MNVLSKFSLFISKQDNKMWVAVGDKTDISIDNGLTFFKDFQTKVAGARKVAFPNTGLIILKSVAS